MLRQLSVAKDEASPHSGLNSVIQILDRVAATDIITAEFNIIFLVDHRYN